MTSAARRAITCLVGGALLALAGHAVLVSWGLRRLGAALEEARAADDLLGRTLAALAARLDLLEDEVRDLTALDVRVVALAEAEEARHQALHVRRPTKHKEKGTPS